MTSSRKQWALAGVAFALFALSTSPIRGVAQELVEEATPSLDASGPAEPGLATEAPVPTPAQSLQPTQLQAELFTPALPSAPEGEDDAPATPPVVAGGGTGLGFMIAGGAALVAGLLIGGTSGDVIAIGGAVLGVYGIIVYF